MDKETKKSQVPPEGTVVAQPRVSSPEEIQANNENVSSTLDGTPEKRENTRSTMAILFVLGFFSILFLCFVYAIMVDASIGDLKDTLIGVAGALSGTLGFIVGYYYKSSQEQ